VSVHRNGETFYRLPFQSFKQFNPGWRCRWCGAPTWPVSTVDGERDCDVDFDSVGLFVDVTIPHGCASMSRGAELHGDAQ
jgi:hypothetical protein